MSSIEYWRECVGIALDEAGLVATKEQIELIADAVCVSHDNYGMAFGHECIPDPRSEEIKKLQTALDNERNKVFCKECNGRGSITVNCYTRSATSQCWKCHGEGKHLP